MYRLLATALAFLALNTGFAQEISQKIDLWKPGKTQLRGANIWQKALFKEGQPFTFDHMETIYTDRNLAKFRHWNANFANISHQGTFHPRTDGSGRYPLIKEIRDHLRQLVWDFRRNQMFVVVSFRTGPGRTEKVFSSGDNTDLLAYLFELDEGTGQLTPRAQKAQDSWVAMWRDTATSLKGEPNVIGYHLLVEPLTTAEWSQTRPGDTRARGSRSKKITGDDPRSSKQLTAWYEFAKRMAGAIREVDRSTPILIGGAPYNAAATLESIPVAQFEPFQPLVFIVSQYEPWEFSEEGIGTYGNEERQRLNTAYDIIGRFAGDKPARTVAVTEFGCTRWAGTPKKPDAPVYLAEQFRLLEKRGCNHAIWLWEVDDLDYNSPFNCRLGVDKANAKSDARSSEILVKTILDNWALNRVFATKDVLAKLR
jgi:hypothetical protein